MSSFETRSSSNAPELTYTGCVVPTISNRLEILVDNAGVQYFRKEDPCQLRQLRFLEFLELPVPPVIVDLPPDAFASIHCGRPLSEILGDENTAPHLFAKAGRLLGLIHFAFTERCPDIDRSLLRTEAAHTAHIVESFRARYVSSTVEPFAKALEQIHSAKGRELSQLLLGMQRCACTLMERSHESDGTHVIYGDYKPDNIVVDMAHVSGTRLTCIDPHMCVGDRRFDLAKFISRVLLEPHGTESLPDLEGFLKSYRSIFDEVGEGGVAASLRELIAMDSLNVLSSYVLLSLKGDKSFRLVAALDEEEYRSYLVQHLESLVSGDGYGSLLKN